MDVVAEGHLPRGNGKQRGYRYRRAKAIFLAPLILAYALRRRSGYRAGKDICHGMTLTWRNVEGVAIVPASGRVLFGW